MKLFFINTSGLNTQAHKDLFMMVPQSKFFYLLLKQLLCQLCFWWLQQRYSKRFLLTSSEMKNLPSVYGLAEHFALQSFINRLNCSMIIPKLGLQQRKFRNKKCDYDKMFQFHMLCPCWKHCKIYKGCASSRYMI